MSETALYNPAYSPSNLNLSRDVTERLPEKDVVYRGDSRTGQVIVIKDGNASALDPRIDLHRYADDFQWGIDSAATLQLALAILCHALGSDRRAVLLHECFAADVLARLTSDSDWMLSRAYVVRRAVAIESSHDLNWMNPEHIYLEEAIQ